MRENAEAGKKFCRLLRGAALRTAGIFRFGQERKEAREALRLAAARRKTAVLNYCILPGELFLIIDRKRLCGIAGADDPADLSRRHLRIVESMLEDDADADIFPFGAFAVGGREEVEKIAAMLPDKMREMRRCKITGLPGAWALFASRRWARSISRNI